MKTITDCKEEISNIKDRIENEEMKKGVENKLRKRVQFLNAIIRLLETNPDKDYISAQIKMVETKVQSRMRFFDESEYEGWNKKDFAKAKKSYEKEYDIPKLRAQVTAMKFIIK